VFDFDKKYLQNLDWPIVIIYILLSIVGLLAIASTTGSEAGYFTSSVKRQLLWMLLSVGVVIVVLGIDYRIFSQTAYILYGVGVLTLIAVFLFGTEINGSTRWIYFGGMSIQPSEFAKIFLVLGFSKYLVSKKDDIDKISTLILALAIAAIPMFLIYMQPDLGTALVLLFAIIVMLFIAGISWKYIATAAVGAIVSAPIAWSMLKDYQKNRILTFFNPELDPLGAAYNVIQSRIAIGSGNWTFLSESGAYLFDFSGKGLFAPDSMTRLRFIPEQYTDFIFSAVGEGMGVIGAGLVIIMMTILIYRSFRIAMRAKDLYGAFVVSGLAGMFLFHFWVNIGMTMGLMPVTGLPLPFISLGGSSFLANSIAIGIILNIGMRYKKIQF
jgi:rod shape determining protein RodA